jgi:hypothetical protein
LINPRPFTQTDAHCQIESSLRFVLFLRGIITSGFDADGIQDEYDINKMLRVEQCTEPLINLFGKDLIFDLKGLLVSRFGSNLRNDMAHGLIDYSGFYTPDACYGL